MQLAPDARQPGTHPPRSGGLADSIRTDSREGYTGPYGLGDACTIEKIRSDEGSTAVEDGGEAKPKGGRERTTAVAKRTRTRRRAKRSPQPMIR